MSRQVFRGAKLTPVEQRIKTLVLLGKYPKAIAVELGLSNSNIRGKLFYIYKKLGVTGWPDLMAARIKELEAELLRKTSS